MDYKSTHFEYKELDNIIGHPDIDALLLIFRQLKRNAQRVHITLWGGKLCYLALVLLETVYDNIINSDKLIQPVLPGPFTVSDSQQSVVELAKSKVAHDKSAQTYNKWQTVEQDLRNQLIDEIPSAYFDLLRNIDSDMINTSIPTIITCWLNITVNW